MDEPLSNLDAKLRVDMRGELARLHERLGVTTVYVTHDQVEAMTLGQRVAVMRDGRIQQVDTPQTLYREPANLFVAAFIGSPSMNLVEAELDDGMCPVRRLPHPARRRPASGRAGRRRDPRHPAAGLRGRRGPSRSSRRSRSRPRSSRSSAPRRTSSSPSTRRRSTSPRCARRPTTRERATLLATDRQTLFTAVVERVVAGPQPGRRCGSPSTRRASTSSSRKRARRSGASRSPRPRATGGRKATPSRAVAALRHAITAK